MKNKQLALVTFEQAQRLKKLGFDYPTTCFYVDIEDSEPKTAFPFYKANRSAFAQEPMNWNMWQTGREFCNTSAPTVALALKWMRDVKGMFGVVDIFFGYDEHGMPYDEPRYGVEALNQSRTTIVDLDDYGHNGAFGYSTYEAAESALLDELLTLIEK